MKRENKYRNTAIKTISGDLTALKSGSGTFTYLTCKNAVE